MARQAIQGGVVPLAALPGALTTAAPCPQTTNATSVSARSWRETPAAIRIVSPLLSW